MGYSSGMLDKKVGIWSVDRQADGQAGVRGTGGVKYKYNGCVCGNVKWNKGMHAMMEGALEAYDVVMIRMRWSDGKSRNLDKDCRLTAEGKTYQILQYHDDQRENIVQIIAQETNEQLGKEQ
jgi:hypothetical protein